METTTDAEILRDLAAAGLKPIEIQGTPCVLVPRGYELKELGHLAPNPQRISENRAFSSLQDLLAYSHRYATTATCGFFTMDWKTPSFRVVFDYHEPDQPHHASHQASYHFPKTPEMQRWLEHDGKHMTQEAFAEFIEENLPDITEPSGAVMLEVARSLEATRKEVFTSSVRLDNGDIHFQRAQETKSKCGDLDVPATFKVALRPYIGGQGYILTASLRHRIPPEGSGLTLSYVLQRPHKLCEEAILATLQDVRKTAAFPIYQV